MARQTTTQLKATFNNDETVDGSDHADWFDSSLNYEDTGTKNISGSLNMVNGGLIASSSIARGDWNDGHLGNDEFMAFTPSDFSINNKPLTTGRSQDTHFIDQLKFVIGRSSGAQNVMAIGNSFYAMKIVPKGFQAINFAVTGTATLNPIECYTCRLTTDNATSRGTGTVQLIPGDPPFTLSSPIIGNGTNYVVIKWTPNANDRLLGAKVGIERI